MTQSTSPPRLALTIEEAAESSALSRTAIFEAVKANQLTLRKLGGRSLILVEDLHAFLAALPAKVVV